MLQNITAINISPIYSIDIKTDLPEVFIPLINSFKTKINYVIYCLFISNMYHKYSKKVIIDINRDVAKELTSTKKKNI